jgi:hypothetical protein
VLDVEVPSRKVEAAVGEALLLCAEVFAEREQLLRARQQRVGPRGLRLEVLDARLDAGERQRDGPLGPVVADLAELAVEDVAGEQRVPPRA